MSAADLIAVLITRYLQYDWAKPKDANNDHLIFSKGHASPLLYAIYKAAGAITDEELLTFRQFGSRIEGHPTPVIPWVDVATGSLGQGLPIGVGMALGARLSRLPYRTWVLCGDSEMAEGSIWEGVEHAGFAKLDNLVAIIDVNRLGQRGPTMHEWNLDSYANRARAAGWSALEIDGHDTAAITAAFTEAVNTAGQPTMIVARTMKGKGVKAVENQENKHGKPLDDPEAGIAELGGLRDIRITVATPDPAEPYRFPTGPLQLPTYEVGSSVATRKAYGDALTALGSANGMVVVLDGEVGNSTYAEEFRDAHPERYFEMYIAEQQLIAAAVGLQTRGYVPVRVNVRRIPLPAPTTLCAWRRSAGRTFACAARTRACRSARTVRRRWRSRTSRLIRAVHGSTVLYPSDANQTAKLVALMADRQGVTFLRTTRGNTPVIYGSDEEFEIGGSRVVRSSDNDDVTIIGAGITLHNAIEAAETLSTEGIRARVVDLYSVKPIDVATLQAAARATGGRLVTVEDHWAEGGIGEAVLSVFATGEVPIQLTLLAVRDMPGSGKPEELLSAAGIDATAIAEAARQLVKTGGRS